MKAIIARFVAENGEEYFSHANFEALSPDLALIMLGELEDKSGESISVNSVEWYSCNMLRVSSQIIIIE